MKANHQRIGKDRGARESSSMLLRLSGRASFPSVGEIVTKHWFLDEMVQLGLQHGIAFLSAIETTFPPTTDRGRAELRGVRDAARVVIRKITKRK